MKEAELSFQVPFTRIRSGLKVSFQVGSVVGAPPGAPTSLGKSLAMAHFYDRAILAQGPGALRALARRWGVTPPCLAQVHALVHLAPDLQEALLLSRPEAGKLTFNSLVAIARKPLWSDQRAAWRKITGPTRHESVSGLNGLSGKTEPGNRPQGQARTEELALPVPSAVPPSQGGPSPSENAELA